MSMKVKKGWLAVYVGAEEDEGNNNNNNKGGSQRFVIPISYLYHPLMQSVLEKAREVYGYHADGPLRLPCSVDDFLHIRWQIEKEANYSSNHHHHHHHHLPTTLSFHSC